jgi:hypothetical protein
VTVTTAHRVAPNFAAIKEFRGLSRSKIINDILELKTLLGEK